MSVGENGTVLGSSDKGETWESLEVAFMIPPPGLIDATILGPNSTSKSAICTGENRIKKIVLSQ